MESCSPGLTGWNFVFLFFPLYKNYTLLFDLPCPPVFKLEAIGQVVAIRANEDKKKVRVIFSLNNCSTYRSHSPNTESNFGGGRIIKKKLFNI